MYNYNLLFSTCVYRVGLKTQPESKCPELLANYCDMLLRKTPLSKKLTSEEIEAKLKEVVCIKEPVMPCGLYWKCNVVKLPMTNGLFISSVF